MEDARPTKQSDTCARCSWNRIGHVARCRIPVLDSLCVCTENERTTVEQTIVDVRVVTLNFARRRCVEHTLNGKLDKCCHRVHFYLIEIDAHQC
jgi:hypothetical protein